ncbi:uncharacterized protein LOC752124 isoform X2 [Strongylocentrotus purpuratus]|uniref:Netrin receptor UNC5 n=1 Tax=Strongylocentrotus purpuratus TaxID=7668 RepID=A0A7M7P216_STRPU|nr:uncharacterized protein LOC752124 isoform X2 [Strongylocentrotus purpuratus]
MAKKSKGVKSYAGSAPYVEGDVSSPPQLSKTSSKAHKKENTKTSLFGLGSKGVKSKVKQRATGRDASNSWGNPLFVLDDVRTLRTGSLDDRDSGLFDDEPRFKSEGYRPRPVLNEEPNKSERKSEEAITRGEKRRSRSSRYPSTKPSWGPKPKWIPSTGSQLDDTPPPAESPPPPPTTSPTPTPPPPPLPTTATHIDQPSNVPPEALLAEIRSHSSKGLPEQVSPHCYRNVEVPSSANKATTTFDGGMSESIFAESPYLASSNLGFADDIKYADDSDNNEGNDDPLTSLKQDSGSNRDDISFGGLSAPPEILARGPRARRAYAEAAQAGTKKVFRTRLMLVGQERVGKTSLKKTLTGQGFDENEAITDGVETTNSCEISIEVAKAGGKMWSIHKKGHENEDTKDEYSKALADEIAKRLIVAPPQNQESSEPLSDTTDGRGLNPEEAEDFVLDTVEAPKAKEEDDNMPNQIASLVEKMLKEQVRLKEIGTARTDNGREGVSLSIWDFAGHDIYYTTHQVFLTWRAIYVIVFDLSRSLDSVVPPESRDEYYEMAKGGAKSELTCLEFINFWLCSIFAHAVAPSSVRSKNTSKTAQKSPPIFIVGTHRESVKGDAKEKKKKIDSAFGKIRKSIKKKPFECHVVPKYYAIENSLEDKDEELVELRRHIEKVAMEEPYIGEEIPLRWLLFEEALAADKINYMSLDQMKELTQPVGMESERELLTMLTFYHDLGYVVYYGGIEDQQSLLRDMVILNPQWLIDVFKQVITILDPAERDGIVSDAWTTLEEDGILEDRLIQHMWQGFLEQKEALVKLMAKFDLICEAPVEQLQQEQQDGLDAEVSNETEVVKKRYYVPSRLTSHCSLEEIGQIKSSTDFYVDFRGFLPDGLFHRLMTRAVRWMGERDGEPVILFYRQISLMVDEEHHALLEMLPCHEATIKVTVFQGAVADSDDDGDSHQPPAQSAVKEVMDFVTSTLDSLRQHWAKRIQYDVCFLCPKCSKKKLFQDCFKRKSLQCGLHRIRTAAVKSKFGMSEEGVESGNESPMICRRSTFKESNVLCDLYFSNLAEQIGSEWHRLGIRLGLNQADIEHITEDKLTAVDRILSLLQLWKKRSSCTDKRKMVEELCKALSSCDRRDLAGDVKEAAGIS